MGDPAKMASGGGGWQGMARNPPVALSALYFLNLRGDVILERQYRDDVE